MCTNERLSFMRYNSHMFVDCTFRSAPAPFTQCRIVMVHDAGTEMFVPCVYSLITSKSESIYLNVFHELIVLTKYNWMPQIYLHLKKGIERKLKKYKLSQSKKFQLYFILGLLRLNMKNKVRTTVVEHFKYKR
ncbi:hypothetical protein HZS_5068 [Henneguya salminicola]|nr:hypothetical protein HZS_5068 [Henneguya salminicola]